MNDNQFYFRCKACNRFLSGHAKRYRNGAIQESDLCSFCTSAAFDSSVEKEYHHQGITDMVLNWTGEDEHEE